ncbi:glycosyltransferase family 39 protein [Kitasatospora sp. HPMI-4]|uniref:glycosyltransferase family 39 protein n=1 Tax=Kitasatospora sp. HPMI-4 TaxID=3448443 RepID=UPI003F1A715E
MTETSALPANAAAEPAARSRRAPLAWRPIAAVLAIAVAVHLAVATRYGWDGDEFYFVICGRHLAWGYVDQPPLTPVLARLAAALPGEGGLVPLRVLAVAAQGGCTLLTALLTAELGGRGRAQAIATAAIATCPIFVGGSSFFGPTVIDQLVWVALFVLVARALRLGTVRAWLCAGLVAGIGLENKDTVAVLLAGIAVGLALFRREVLRTRGPWLAGLLAVLIALPNVLWDASHHWPNLDMAGQLSRQQGGTLGSLAKLPELPLYLGGMLLIGLWVIGIRHLWSPRERGHCWVLAVATVAVVVFTLSGGKQYYAAPALAGLFAAGGVRVEAADTPRGRRAWPTLLTASALSTALLFLPILPVSTAGALRALDPVPMETYGWPRFVDMVAEAAGPLPPDTPIFTSDYGEAGALTVLGPAAGVDNPVYSGHNNHALWGPPPGSPSTALCVGSFTADDLRRGWAKVTKVATYTLPGGLSNSETIRGTAVYLCQDPRADWAQLWPHLKHFD